MPKNFDDDDFDRDEKVRRDRDDRDRDRERFDDPPPKQRSPILWILGILGGVLFLICGGAVVCVILLIGPAVQRARENQARIETINNMKFITLGAVNYVDDSEEWVHNRWNNTNTVELLSWRYELFPFIEQDNVYNIANRSKPWNDPANAVVLNTNIRTFKHASDKTATNRTYFQAFSGTGAILDPKSPRKGRLNGQPRPLNASNMLDGLSNTLFLVEANTQVSIIQPLDIPFPGGPLPTLGVNPKDTTFVGAFCDGSVRNLRKTSITPQGLTAWVCPNDGAIPPLD